MYDDYICCGFKENGINMAFLQYLNYVNIRTGHSF